MKRALNHKAMPAVGFIEPWSVPAGGETDVFVSCVDPDAAYSVVSLDRDREEQFDWDVRRHGEAFVVRDYSLGSFVELPEAAAPGGSKSWELSFEFLLTRNPARRPICAIGDATLSIDPENGLVVEMGSASRAMGPVKRERWHELRVTMRGDSIRWAVAHRGEEVHSLSTTRSGVKEARRVLIGTDGKAQTRTLNGRVGRIAVARDSRAYSWVFRPRGLLSEVPAAEDEDVRLTVHNMPVAAVASPRFTGEVHDPRVDPSHFDAIHLHDDDFAGFDWSPDLTVSIPANARSGVYAVKISSSRGTEKLPFFVARKEAEAKIAFLVPTNTYLAYSDERLPRDRYPWHGTDRGHEFSNDNELLSLYDVHTDLSGVSLTSSRRPRATLRDDYHYPLSNSPHNLSVDLHLLKFYAREGVEVAVLTDRDLHDQGVAALSPFKGILSGSHPEYWSDAMMKAFHAYLGLGGNFAYLGGNGFYWIVAHEGHVMELRREQDPMIWAGRPGEGHLQLTGEPGGKWDFRGPLAPQTFLGVTFQLMGFARSKPFRRLEASYDEAFSWIFEGLDDGPIGDTGAVLGGAAGYEVDAVVHSKETPGNLKVLATADGFAPDEFLIRNDQWLEGDEAELQSLRRCDMTAYRHEGGGIVFCASSVAWIGALPGAGEENNVGKIMMNIATGFAR